MNASKTWAAQGHKSNVPPVIWVSGTVAHIGKKRFIPIRCSPILVVTALPASRATLYAWSLPTAQMVHIALSSFASLGGAAFRRPYYSIASPVRPLELYILLMRATMYALIALRSSFRSQSKSMLNVHELLECLRFQNMPREGCEHLQHSI